MIEGDKPLIPQVMNALANDNVQYRSTGKHKKHATHASQQLTKPRRSNFVPFQPSKKFHYQM